MEWTFASVEDLYQFGRYLLSMAPTYGAIRTEDELKVFFSGYWGSKLEALGEFREGLHFIATEVIERFPPEVGRAMTIALSEADRQVEIWFRGIQ